MRQRTCIAAVVLAAALVVPSLLYVRPAVRARARQAVADARPASHVPLLAAQQQQQQQQSAKGTPRAASAASALPRAAAIPQACPKRGAFADPEVRADAVRRLREQSRKDREQALQRAEQEGWDASPVSDRGRSMLVAIRGDRVCVYELHNLNAGISIGADLVRSTPPHDLTGSGVRVGLWDSGHPRYTHREYAGRVDLGEAILQEHYHATHIAGTIGATGITSTAIGMAPQVRLLCHDWTDDMAEMAAAGKASESETNTIQVSNHSYGQSSGWTLSYSPPRWYGAWGRRESENFGLYDWDAAMIDAICYSAPYYLPCRSAGNDRTDAAPAANAQFSYYDNGWKVTNYDAAVHPYSDNVMDGGFDTIPTQGNAKNVITIGAVEDAVSGGLRSIASGTMTSYSSWGPSDDGRMKPDVVANGQFVYSCGDSSDSAYTTLSGSSMAVGTVVGGAALLIEQFGRIYTNRCMLASTLKGLILHTADDIANAGPDYMSGWGLVNIRAAADLVADDFRFPGTGRMTEDSVSNASPVRTIEVLWDNISPLRATLCWTDPPGDPATGLDDPARKLVNDLDLRIIDPSGTTNFPFVLDRANPGALATRGDNNLDNVEQVLVASPTVTGVYKVVVSADGTLSGGEQAYSLLVSGSSVTPVIEHTPLQNTTNMVDPYPVDAVVTSREGLAVGSPIIVWSNDGSTNLSVTNTMLLVTNCLYRGQIPSQPFGTIVHYRIHAVTTNGLRSSHPGGDGSGCHVFEITDALELVVNGYPAQHAVPVPGYGSSLWPSGFVVSASVSESTTPEDGRRFLCTGWTGMGSVPAIGISNSFTFALCATSTIGWLWAEQYLLDQTSTVAGVTSTGTWWTTPGPGQTITAAVEATSVTTKYHFVEWLVDGDRQPDATNRASNPATGIVMDRRRYGTVVYLQKDLDGDTDGLPDWWERYYFGSTAPGPADDPDGDGFNNFKEMGDGSQPDNGLSRPALPVIVHVPLSDPQASPAPWTVTATVTDNWVVAGVTLHWQRNGGPESTVAMSTGAVPSLYAGTIALPGGNDDSFQYWLSAVDGAGYSTQSSVNSFDVRYAVHAIEPTGLPTVVLAPGACTNAVLGLTNSGLATLQWTASFLGAGLHDDVESGTNGWTHSGTNDLWHISTGRSWSASSAWYCGREACGLYLDGMDAMLVSPSVRLGCGTRLVFRHWLATELQGGNRAWDGGVVDLSVDGGPFGRLTPVGGYPFIIFSNSTARFPPNTPCFAGTGVWERVVFDLSAYDGRDARVRFRFSSDGSIVAGGWYVDDVLIVPGCGTNEWFSFSPTGGELASFVATNILVGWSAAGMATGDRAGCLRLVSNDPIRQTNDIVVSLSVRSAPSVEFVLTAQTSTNGTGTVTASNKVYEPDGDNLALAYEFSADGGNAWTDAWLRAVSTSFGSCSVSGGTGTISSGILIAEEERPATNAITAQWSSTNGPQPVALATNTLLRARAWDGVCWSPWATGQSFLVDNQAPGLPVSPVSTSHLVIQWTTGSVVSARWGPAGDGAGGGVAGYGYDFAVALTTQPPPRVMAADTQAVSQALADGTNWHFVVRAIDVYGNVGATTGAGPYWIDTTMPDASVATVTMVRSSNGNYALGLNVTSSWAGFRDAGSGVKGYYFSLENREHSADGSWTTGTGGVALAAADATNTIYVWAEDNCGLIGAAASNTVLVLSQGGDWDGDSLKNGDEETAGTDASDRSSVFAAGSALFADAPTGTIFVIQWQSATGRTYSVEMANALGSTWVLDPLFANVAGTGSLMVYSNPVAVPRRFYRLLVAMPE